jgi:hypothetical protein
MKKFKEFIDDSTKPHIDNMRKKYVDSLVPVPDMHIFVTRTPMGGSQSLDTALHFAEKLGEDWRIPTTEELDELLDRRDELKLAKPFTGDNENLYNYRYWCSGETNYVCHVGEHTFDSRIGDSYVFYVKDFNEAEKQKYSGAKWGKQYGI